MSFCLAPCGTQLLPSLPLGCSAPCTPTASIPHLLQLCTYPPEFGPSHPLARSPHPWHCLHFLWRPAFLPPLPVTVGWCSVRRTGGEDWSHRSGDRLQNSGPLQKVRAAGSQPQRSTALCLYWAGCLGPLSSQQLQVSIPRACSPFMTPRTCLWCVRAGSLAFWILGSGCPLSSPPLPLFSFLSEPPHCCR